MVCPKPSVLGEEKVPLGETGARGAGAAPRLLAALLRWPILVEPRPLPAGCLHSWHFPGTGSASLGCTGCGQAGFAAQEPRPVGPPCGLRLGRARASHAEAEEVGPGVLSCLPPAEAGHPASECPFLGPGPAHVPMHLRGDPWSPGHALLAHVEAARSWEARGWEVRGQAMGHVGRLPLARP